MSRILVITHPGGGTSGVFLSGAQAAGCELEEWTPALAPLPPRALDEYAGLVILGGDQNICEQERFPFLTAEIALTREWLASGRPLLGVCLGAQMIAEAAGGSVFRASERELGWLTIDLLEAAADDPVLGFGEQHLRGLQWHSYSVEPPPGAVALARSPVCIQAFRLGAAWGVQFHPEVTREIIEDWILDLRAGADAVSAARDESALRVGLEDGSLERWNAYGRELMRRFAEQVG